MDKNPSSHTCLLLGDAYMSIQEVSVSLTLILPDDVAFVLCKV